MPPGEGEPHTRDIATRAWCNIASSGRESWDTKKVPRRTGMTIRMQRGGLGAAQKNPGLGRRGSGTCLPASWRTRGGARGPRDSIIPSSGGLLGARASKAPAGLPFVDHGLFRYTESRVMGGRLASYGLDAAASAASEVAVLVAAARARGILRGVAEEDGIATGTRVRGRTGKQLTSASTTQLHN